MPEKLSQHLSLYPERCLNNRSAGEFCRLCVDACPERAIELVEEGICFDDERCHECALCVIDCPTDTYLHAGFAASWLVAAAADREQLDIHCQFSRGERSQGGLLIPCHGLLGERLLIGLHAAGVRTLRLHGLDGCESCPSRVGESRLDAAAAKAAVRPEMVKVAKAGAGGVGATAVAEVDRRGFMGQMGKGMAYAAMHTLPGALQTDGGRQISSGQHGLLAKHLPDQQRLALELLADDRADIAWFFQLQANAACDLCNICSFACPTGSLAIGESGGSRQLQHRPDSCIGCGLCLSLCPQQALEFSEVDQALLRQGGSLTLQAQAQAICRACGSGFSALAGNAELCSRCEREQSIRNQWLKM